MSAEQDNAGGVDDVEATADHHLAGPAATPAEDDGVTDEVGDDVIEVEVLEVEVVSVDVVEVDAETAYAARDAALEQAADGALDGALDGLDEGDREVRAASAHEDARHEHVPTGPGELPLLIAARERFSSLDDVAVTGDARVDAATARLDELPDLPTAEHVAVYDDVHHRLQDALADADPR